MRDRYHALQLRVEFEAPLPVENPQTLESVDLVPGPEDREPTMAALRTACRILFSYDPAAHLQAGFEKERDDLARLIDEESGLPEAVKL